jgi:2-polyprenyl-3-methyl-5-hydroxy-6-metoxy-1,4-benzoquinol methylase
MARMAGATGRALGVDFDAGVIDLARADAAEAGVACDFRAGDCLAVEGEFDVCYARFLLSHVADPAAVLRQMGALARPGGVVVVEDTDFSGFFCEPEDPAHEAYAQLAAGLRDPEVSVAQSAHMAGVLKLLNRVTSVSGCAHPPRRRSRRPPAVCRCSAQAEGRSTGR